MHQLDVLKPYAALSFRRWQTVLPAALVIDLDPAINCGTVINGMHLNPTRGNLTSATFSEGDNSSMPRDKASDVSIG
jgi:hypothetical protein